MNVDERAWAIEGAQAAMVELEELSKKLRLSVGPEGFGHGDIEKFRELAFAVIHNMNESRRV